MTSRTDNRKYATTPTPQSNFAACISELNLIKVMLILHRNTCYSLPPRQPILQKLWSANYDLEVNIQFLQQTCMNRLEQAFVPWASTQVLNLEDVAILSSIL